jgi:hypothetical protein
MAFLLRSIGLLALVALAVSAGAMPAQPVGGATLDSTCGYQYEVRIRKIHLVRPDLIPYPISYEIVC